MSKISSWKLLIKMFCLFEDDITSYVFSSVLHIPSSVIVHSNCSESCASVVLSFSVTGKRRQDTGFSVSSPTQKQTEMLLLPMWCQNEFKTKTWKLLDKRTCYSTISLSPPELFTVSEELKSPSSHRTVPLAEAHFNKTLIWSAEH